MNNEDIRKWCHQEMRALADSPMHARGRAILALVNAADAPLWLADAAEALGEVRPSDGAPLALNWTQVIQGIRELREDRNTLLKVSRIVNDALNGESPLYPAQRAIKALHLAAEALGRPI